MYKMISNLKSIVSTTILGKVEKGEKTIGNAMEENTLPKLLIGTHHKCGTVWLVSIFRTICNKYSLNLYKGLQEDLPDNYDLFCQERSLFELEALEKPFRGIHIIRDPRDIIISGCFYHQKANEKWLHETRNDFEGLSYQERINQCKSLDEKISFEMEHSAKWNFTDIISWDYSNPYFLELKYEDLINDTNLLLFHKIFSFLGFPARMLPDLLAVSYQNSLFSGMVKGSEHIRSGKTGQWRKYLNKYHRNRFIELYGDLLINLGYEKNNDWIIGD